MGHLAREMDIPAMNIPQKSWLAVGIVALVLALATALLTPGLVKKGPIKIGFIGGISGRVADLGMAGRDGTILAIEECNAQGGINGQPLTLLVRDDHQDPLAAEAATRDLLDQGVVGLIGPMTSSMAVVVAPLINAVQIPAISPSASTTRLTGKDDFFFRVYPDSAQETPQISQIAAEQLGLRRIAIICDLANGEYTLNWADWFTRDFVRRGGQVFDKVLFQSGPQVLFADVAAQALAENPDGILLLTNSVDTALLAQKIRQREPDIPLLVSEWSTTQELIELGGRAVEGIIFLHTYNAQLKAPAFLRFKAAFEKRFGYEGGFPAIKGYDAAQFLILGLKGATSPQQLKPALQAVEGFSGLQNDYQIDRFGDIQQQEFVMTIRNGRFEPLHPD